MRSTRRKPPVFENTDLLRGNASCEALAALRAAALENRASCACLHSCAKSMRSFPADTTRLIGAFHRRPSILFFVLFEGERGSGSSFPSGIRPCRSAFGFSPSRASTLFWFVRTLVYLNTQGREPSDHLTFAPTAPSSPIKLTDERPPPVLRCPLSRRTPLVLRGISARHDRIGQNRKLIASGQFDRFCRV
jgi:hypothetical protein